MKHIIVSLLKGQSHHTNTIPATEYNIRVSCYKACTNKYCHVDNTPAGRISGSNDDVRVANFGPIDLYKLFI